MINIKKAFRNYITCGFVLKCVYIVKTEGFNVSVLICICPCMFVCMYAKETQVLKSGVCVCMCEVIWHSTRSSEHGRVANITISL